MNLLARRILYLTLACTRLAVAQPISETKPLATKPAGSIVGQWQSSGTNGAVAAGGAEAVEAGVAILRDGGNAADAVVATILAQCVTDANQFCFGGEVPILVYDAKRKVVEVLAGQGAAPRLATREHFTRPGGIPASGIEAAAVPATLDVCLTALDRYGSKRFAEVVAPALRILDRGEYAWHADLARTLRRLVAAERLSDDRRRGLRLVADYFYRGPIAREIDAWSRANGGLIREVDLATHVTRVEDPVMIEYRGHVVAKCGPWTQGPALLEALQILEPFDLATMGHNRPDAIHVTVEAIKLAFADRDVYYADPLFQRVPLNALLRPEYASMRRALINMNQASLEQRPGDPVGGKPLLAEAESRHGLEGPSIDTTTCLAADAEGNMMAATPSGWSGVLAGSTGVWLGSRLQSFNTWEGHPNCIEPGKRPRITLTPTIVLKDGRPRIAVSVAGGDLQDQVTLQMLLDLIDFRLSPAEAVTAPRFVTHHFLGSFRQTPPKLGSLDIGDEVEASTLTDLRIRGHHLNVLKPPFGHPVVIRIDPDSKRIEAAGDPKAKRHASAY
ncbi:gamma-glutamyltransferase [Singulisphaera sp. Ch08]|uniref:Gamma-glutamyltransferase n=1 Tax=Singulisphaera sp. Ch08 TaxID=3120278 RepID=A0AAU7CAJ3_9BACT